MTRETALISIVGSRGRMGRALSHLIEGEFNSRARVHVPIHSQSPEDEWTDALQSDVWVDFSLPAGLSAIHRAISKNAPSRVPALIIGTTGHNAEERALIENLASKTLVLQAANFSLGILLLRKTLEFVSPQLSNAGFNPLLIETHHLHKKDAPSGTALTLAASTSGMTPEKIHSIRAGEVVGDHELVFHGHGEQVRLTHHALTRDLFARGALETALWISEKRAQSPGESGLLSLDDFFEERFACLTPSR